MANHPHHLQSLSAVAVELLARLRAAGCRIEACGEDLVVEGPAMVLTDDLRAAVRAAKPELLRQLAAEARLVTLRGGLTGPVEPLELALELKRRGFRLNLDAAGELVIEPGARLTEPDRAAITRWQCHLAAIIRAVDQLLPA